MKFIVYWYVFIEDMVIQIVQLVLQSTLSSILLTILQDSSQHWATLHVY